MTGGAIGDRYGRKGALLGGLLVFGLGALLGGLADSAEVILVARGAMGVAAAFVMPATLSLLIEIFPPPERPLAIAVWSGFAGGGAAIGPALTGLFVTGWWFVPSWGWEAGFLYNVPVVAVVIIVMALWLPRSRDEHPRHLDPAGAGLSIVAMTALIYGIIEGPSRAGHRRRYCRPSQCRWRSARSCCSGSGEPAIRCCRWNCSATGASASARRWSP